MENIQNRKFWIIRIGDGENFKNSKFPIWGIKRGKNGCIKSVVKKMKEGDILWFMTSKKYGGKMLAVSEYRNFYDKSDESLIQIHTKTNDVCGWKGEDEWDIQLHYHKLYITERQNITGCIQSSSIILDYEKYKDKIEGDLMEHYRNFVFYGESKISPYGNY